MSKPKLLFFDGSDGYADPFKDIYDIVTPESNLSIVGNIAAVDCVLFSGGSDISPYLYGDNPIRATSPFLERDKFEEVVFRIAMDQKKAVIGICRGAQLACAMAGGRLYQDVTGHIGGHQVQTHDGKDIHMSSLHHQMMRLDNTEHKLLAWSKGISRHYHMGYPLKSEAWKEGVILTEEPKDGIEPDTVYFSEIRALGFQGHPEMLSPARPEDKITLDWVSEQVKQHLLN